MRESHAEDGQSIQEPIVTGLSLLWRSYRYANDVATDTWEFAVEISELRNVGLTNSDLRWLVAKQFAEHRQELTVFDDEHRSFKPSRGLTFIQTTAFVLTDAGAVLANELLAEDERADDRCECSSPKFNSTKAQTPTFKCPTWDSRSRELRVAGILVKNFRVRADNQVAILAAFEEEGWPDFIDDPLPGSSEVEPKRRLHNAINRLNQNQLNTLLQFHGNGTGQGVGWRLLADTTHEFGHVESALVIESRDELVDESDLRSDGRPDYCN